MVIKKLVAMATVLMLMNVRDAVVSLSQQDTDRDANISRQKNNRADLSSLTAAMERRTRKQCVVMKKIIELRLLKLNIVEI